MRANEQVNRGYNNFVEVIDNYDKAQGRKWRFIAFTIVVFSVAAIYLSGVIFERYSTPRFPTIQQQISITIESNPGEMQSLISPTEENPAGIASPTDEAMPASSTPAPSQTAETIRATASLPPILQEATERAWSAQQSIRGR